MDDNVLRLHLLTRTNGSHRGTEATENAQRTYDRDRERTRRTTEKNNGHDNRRERPNGTTERNDGHERGEGRAIGNASGHAPLSAVV
jgi:hypothetical protein